MTLDFSAVDFGAVAKAPDDAILGLNDAFARDANPRKINLGAGVYKDASGRTPILRSVKLAEERILETERSKTYLGIQGSDEYGRAVQELLFAPRHAALTGRAVTVQTPGGTGALRVAADFLKKVFPTSKVWLSDPTWPNHPGVFQAAGLAVGTYPYFDAAANALDFERMMRALGEIPAGGIVLLHGCCHNPTGSDPTLDQWQQIAELVARRGLLPFVDFAYQGLAEGIREDAVGVAALARTGCDLLVASSFSKNFGLYSERVGALTAVCRSEPAAQAVMSQLKACIRTNYSNPPAHGSEIVTIILSDPELRKLWDGEVRDIRERINGMRSLFVQTLADVGIPRDFSFIARQRGMFSFSGLNPEQVRLLRDEHAIYIVGSGRINVAGMTADNVRPLCEAIAAVLEQTSAKVHV
jgi:aspartate/tyrosine/aromatic aminotransferase